jgi:glycosyltransferase involved in cell wall biosynthesis
MKIVFLTREFPPDSLWGGPAIVYHNYATSLTAKGHEVHVICQAVGEPKDLLDQGIFVHRVGTNCSRYSVGARINYSLFSWLKLRQIIRKYEIDLVEAVYWSAEGFLCSFSKQTPLIVAAQTPISTSSSINFTSNGLQRLTHKFLNFLADFTALRADKIIANSKLTYANLSKRVFCRRGGRIELVKHGIDTKRFSTALCSPSESNSIKSRSSPTVLFVGRLEPRKGIHILFQSIPMIVEKIPNVQFTIIGNDTNFGPNGTSYKHFLLGLLPNRSLVKRLRFIDFLPEDELVTEYASCGLFVLPSLTESFGLPVIEAMSCGRPVVSSATGIASELDLKPPYGIVVKPGDVKQLASAIISLLSITKSQSDEVNLRNRDFVQKNFSLDYSTDKLLEVYKKAVMSKQ